MLGSEGQAWAGSAGKTLALGCNGHRHKDLGTPGCGYRTLATPHSPHATFGWVHVEYVTKHRSQNTKLMLRRTKAAQENKISFWVQCFIISVATQVSFSFILLPTSYAFIHCCRLTDRRESVVQSPLFKIWVASKRFHFRECLLWRCSWVFLGKGILPRTGANLQSYPQCFCSSCLPWILIILMPFGKESLCFHC